MSKKIRQPNLTPQAIQFSQQLTNTGFWIDKADELLTAADILEGEVVQYWAEIGIKDGQVVGTPKRRNIQGPYFLLIAVEGDVRAESTYQSLPQFTGLSCSLRKADG